MRAVRAVGLALIVSVGLVGCASTDDPADGGVPAGPDDVPLGPDSDTTVDAPPAPRPEGDSDGLEVVETAFGQATYDDGLWWFVVVLDNPDPELGFAGATVTVDAVDADGAVLDTAWEDVTAGPGEVAMTGVFAEVGDGEIDHLEVRGPDADDAAVLPGGSGEFSVADLTADSTPQTTTVTGVLSGTFTEERTFIDVIVVARDAAGAIIGAETTYVPLLPAGGTAELKVVFWDPLPDSATYTAYPRL